MALATIRFSALVRDLFEFAITSQILEELSQHVEPSRKAQANWVHFEKRFLVKLHRMLTGTR